jgi:MFS transporter, DHA1 family, multidrug resistance protein
MRTSSTFLLIMLGALSGLTPLAVDMYLPAIPSIAVDLRASVEAVQLTISTFLVGFAIGQLFYGPMADSFGRKPVILFGVALFVVASIGCIFAESLPVLLSFRLLQAIGGAAGAVVVNALLRDLFTPDEVVRAMTIVILTMTLAPLVAPLLGGAMLGLGWQSIFILLALLGALLWVAILVLIPETLKAEHRQPLHLGTVLGNYYRVLCHRKAMGSMLASTFASAGMFAFISGSPYVYIQYFGIAPQHYGLLFGLNVLFLMLMTFINGRLVKRVGLLAMLRLGLVLSAGAGVVLFINGASGWGGLWGIVVPVCCYVGQLGLVGANATSHALGFFPANAGTASALAGTMRFGAGALAGVAVNSFPATSALPMAGVMAACGVLALVAHLWLGRTIRTARG